MANDDYTSNDSTFTITYDGASCNCTSNYASDGSLTWTVRVPPPRRFYVRIPKHWKKSKIDGFAGLVNEETRTGWRVTALVRVVKKYDKTETISMEKFKEMLLQSANAADQQVIIGWFKRAK